MAIATDDGFTVIELVSAWVIDVGDQMNWENGTALGSEVYENQTKRSHEEVFVQDHHVSKAVLETTYSLIV
ncbi:MAG: hypothetical protein JWM43_3911 [Acidobacteriaceae bacterium]|nr:hypothetical protein [Acidobacteriaceae bacterium]